MWGHRQVVSVPGVVILAFNHLVNKQVSHCSPTTITPPCDIHKLPLQFNREPMFVYSNSDHCFQLKLCVLSLVLLVLHIMYMCNCFFSCKSRSKTKHFCFLRMAFQWWHQTSSESRLQLRPHTPLQCKVNLKWIHWPLDTRTVQDWRQDVLVCILVVCGMLLIDCARQRRFAINGSVRI